MAILTRLTEWCSEDKKSKENNLKEDDSVENIYVKDGIRYIRDVRKLSDELLEKSLVSQFLNLYCHRLVALDKKYKKTVPWDSVRSLIIDSVFSREFLRRNYSQENFNYDYNHYDLSSLHRHFKVFNRPYILQVTDGDIVVSFIYNITPEKNSISEYTEEEIKNASNSKQHDMGRDFVRHTNFFKLKEKMLSEYNIDQYINRENSNRENNNHENEMKETDVLLELSSPRKR